MRVAGSLNRNEFISYHQEGGFSTVPKRFVRRTRWEMWWRPLWLRGRAPLTIMFEVLELSSVRNKKPAFKIEE